jgi:hypothetical protein
MILAFQLRIKDLFPTPKLSCLTTLNLTKPKRLLYLKHFKDISFWSTLIMGGRSENCRLIQDAQES